MSISREVCLPGKDSWLTHGKCVAISKAEERYSCTKLVLWNAYRCGVRQRRGERAGVGPEGCQLKTNLSFLSALAMS